MYTYIKAPQKISRPRHSKLAGFGSVVFLTIGLFLIFQATWPVVGWYFFVMPGVSAKIISPLATTFSPLVRASEGDSYTPSAWFAGAAKIIPASQTMFKIYELTIPKLKIESAKVEVGGNLKESLVAWPTSALPGGYGNNIIFGHSELPQFASPKSYSGIFTFLMDLNEGDEIFLNYDAVRYRYKVVSKKVVEPDDISVLEQRFDSAYVTLITCVPPGTLWKRGIIRAKIAPI